jgi:hypothetical protein
VGPQITWFTLLTWSCESFFFFFLMHVRLYAWYRVAHVLTVVWSQHGVLIGVLSWAWCVISDYRDSFNRFMIRWTNNEVYRLQYQACSTSPTVLVVVRTVTTSTTDWVSVTARTADYMIYITHVIVWIFFLFFLDACTIVRETPNIEQSEIVRPVSLLNPDGVESFSV